jgi:diketogulonate reductase-like aldo/keto reductase
MRWREDHSIYNSLKADSLAEEVEASLRRLAWKPSISTRFTGPIPTSEIEEGWEALARMREQGKLRWIGVSNFSMSSR